MNTYIDYGIKGKTSIVTGSAQGIGREIAIAFLKTGTNVVAADINEESLVMFSRVVKNEDYPGSLAIVKTDVSSVSDLDNMVNTAVQKFGGVDILVNNAGILHSTPVEEITEAEWDTIMAINLKGMFFASQKVIPYMKTKNWGRIVNISSLAGRMGGYANGLAYSASKAGIIGLSQGLARRIADSQITVNTVAPGTTESSIIDQFSEEKKAELKKMIPLGRMGQPTDIANLVVFLSSELTGFITGAVIDINGGMYMG
ncbi:MAG: 3-oxoacyl-ACP reductase FabG [Spirochaetales bacterium]|nr:3-oxoacyl-ACP reductase FabG [Spirochaetales bacterium]